MQMDDKKNQICITTNGNRFLNSNLLYHNDMHSIKALPIVFFIYTSTYEWLKPAIEGKRGISGSHSIKVDT